MEINRITQVILDSAYHVHSRVGPGLLESVYETILAIELTRRGLSVERQVSIPIVYEGQSVGDGFRADLVIEKKVIVELKSVEALQPVHGKQLLTQLRMSGLHVGLLINFGVVSLKDGIKRVVNRLPED